MKGFVLRPKRPEDVGPVYELADCCEAAIGWCEDGRPKNALVAFVEGMTAEEQKIFEHLGEIDRKGPK